MERINNPTMSSAVVSREFDHAVRRKARLKRRERRMMVMLAAMTSDSCCGGEIAEVEAIQNASAV